MRQTSWRRPSSKSTLAGLPSNHLQHRSTAFHLLWFERVRVSGSLKCTVWTQSIQIHSHYAIDCCQRLHMLLPHTWLDNPLDDALQFRYIGDHFLKWCVQYVLCSCLCYVHPTEGHPNCVNAEWIFDQ